MPEGERTADKSRDRIVIASPLPDPVVNWQAIAISAAVQFKAPHGTEQAGIAHSDAFSAIGQPTKKASFRVLNVRGSDSP
jgi:hypothetical protein